MRKIVAIDMADINSMEEADRLSAFAELIRHKHNLELVLFDEDSLRVFAGIPSKEDWNKLVIQSLTRAYVDAPIKGNRLHRLLDYIEQNPCDKCVCFTNGLVTTMRPQPCQWLWVLDREIEYNGIAHELRAIPRVLWGDRIFAASVLR